MRLKRPDAAIIAAGILFVVYAASLAPDVTFWDAGEFIAAAHAFGIPHPPGTPLFVLLLRAWTLVLRPLPFAVATNLLSACATVLAGAVTARVVQRATSSAAMAVAAVISAGSMTSVWLKASETEVYAASLALAVLTIWAGDRAGRSGDERWTVLTAYLIALGVPLHLSALVAAPAAIVLAAVEWPVIRWRRVLVLGGVFVFAMGAGRMAAWLCVAGAIITLASVSTRAADAPRDRGPDAHALPFAALGAAAIAVSALAFLLVRARHDPAINQGNPSTLSSLATVVARKQYAVAPMWPRMAPWWLQLANFGQYADWQTALSLGPTVLPSIPRAIATIGFCGLGYVGGSTHWRIDRRTWLGMLTLFVCGSLGVIVYLNLHAGPSIGYGYFQPDIAREARERDYFFVFAFWAWGVWAGVGAVALLRRFGLPDWSGVLLAAVPIALNWSAVTRRADPEDRLPRLTAEAFLGGVPSNGVLFVSGDNDSYPLWYAQQVLGVRRDVAVVTVPLLPTEWYRSEVARRFHLLDADGVHHYDNTLNVAARIADGARRAGRPVAASMMLTRQERSRLGRRWNAGAMDYVECVADCALVSGDTSDAGVDAAAANRWAAWISARLSDTDVRPAIDPIDAYFVKLLECPRQFADAAASNDFTRLDSVCNYR